MAMASEWSMSVSSPTRFSSGVEVLDLETMPGEFNFITCLAIVQQLGFTFLPLTWEAARQDIGSGGTSRVHEASQNLGTSLAFKRIHETSKEQKTEKQIFQILVNEIMVLGQAFVRKHPNIVELQGLCWDISPIDNIPWPVLVFEKTGFGDLLNFAKSSAGRELDGYERLKLCKEIGIAVSDMHSANIIYGNIKPENVLIFKDESGQYVAKVMDFGYSTHYASDNHQIKLPISWPWNAPEHDRCNRQWTPSKASQADTFSFGMLCLWLLFETQLLEMQAITSDHNLSNDNTSGSTKFTLSQIKMQVQTHTKQFLRAASGFNDKERSALEGLFDSSLSLDPQQRDGSIDQFLQTLDAGRQRASSEVNATLSTEDNSLHLKFSIQKSIHALYAADYRLRLHIAKKLLEEYCCNTSVALQVAFCYHIGFGTVKNDTKAKEVLDQNNLNIKDLHDLVSQCYEDHSFDVAVENCA